MKQLALVLAILLSASCLCMAKGSAEARGADSSASVVQMPDAGRTEAQLGAMFLEKADEVVIGKDSVTFTDCSGSGKPVTVMKNPSKVAVLYASFTTLWYEAGGQADLVIGGSSAAELYKQYIGRDITQDPGVVTVASNASGKRWDIEKTIACKPDIIICSTAMNGYETIKGPAQAAGIPVIAVDYTDFSDYLKWFRVFSALTGHEELWESVALKALEEVVSVLCACPSEGNPRVLSLFHNSTTIQANTSNTVLGGMIKAMNAENIVDSWDAPLSAERLDMNLETVFASDPDIILVQCHSGIEMAMEEVSAMFGSNPVWQALSAVRNGRVCYLDKDLFHNKPNSRFAEAYKVLAGYLYPDLVEIDRTNN